MTTSTTNTVTTATDEWELDYSKTGVVIGLEIHIQLNKLNTKLFCACNSDYRGAEPNTHCCPVCLGLPGSLPVVNKRALEFATTLALAVDSTISGRQFFHRKNYYYPDMARNYQISQYNRGGGVPFAEGGKVIIKTKDGKPKHIMLDRMHLEDDPGKLVHKGNFDTSPYTLVDYNRCGTTLIELVTKPVMYDPEEARAFCNKLKSIISHCNISDVTMDGAFRVDANISIEGGERVEIKNIGSVKDVEKALRWEIFRHQQEKKRGQPVGRETRAWNGRATILLRSKEYEDDYRYFPDPDLVPFEVSQEVIKKVKKGLPELPDQRMIRFMNTYNLSEYDSDVLISDKNLADFFESCAKKISDYKAIVNWLNNDIAGYLNDQDKDIGETKITPKLLIELIEMIQKNEIPVKLAKKMIPDLLEGKSAKKLAKEQQIQKITDPAILNPICDQIIQQNPQILQDMQKKPKAFMGLVGKVMQATKGQADSELVQKMLADKTKFDLSTLNN
jgi:aspartyl-tRNA(Asn)/glutamyl-tRNA(Gln) amidotransferase subunit B